MGKGRKGDGVIVRNGDGMDQRAPPCRNKEDEINGARRNFADSAMAVCGARTIEKSFSTSSFFFTEENTI